MTNLITDHSSRKNRFLAFLIDILPLTALVFVVFYFFLGFDETIQNYLNRGDDIKPRKIFLDDRNLIREISFLIWMLYCAIMEASSWQGTLGKHVMKIKVVDENGNRLSPMLSLRRNTMKILSFIVLSAGFIWILFDPKRQGWHDKIAKTFVVNKI